MEKKFRKIIEKMMQSKGYFVYHIKDVKNTGPRIADLICCINGWFVAIETKIKKKKEISSDDAISLLTPHQKLCAFDIIKNKGKYYVIIFAYTNSGINIDGTYGRVFAYELKISENNVLYAKRIEKFYPNKIVIR